jgi:hypothetical protein
MEEPPLLDAFCRFFLDLNPRRLVLTHLNEFGRDANDLWDDSHVQRVSSKFNELNPGISVASAYTGEHIVLL